MTIMVVVVMMIMMMMINTFLEACKCVKWSACSEKYIYDIMRAESNVARILTKITAAICARTEKQIKDVIEKYRICGQEGNRFRRKLRCVEDRREINILPRAYGFRRKIIT
jgi:hypothetical protein